MISMLSPLRRSLGIAFEADELEMEFGRKAVDVVGERILNAVRGERRRLYRLHDELTRRAALVEERYTSGPIAEAELVAA